MSPQRLTGVVLAGGTSRRMGADKARLPVGATPLAVHVARRIATVCDPVLLASGDGERLADLGFGEVADVADGQGPLAGIVAGLTVATTELVAVVAVDLPFASPDVLALLAERWDGEHAVVPSDGDAIQPLHGVYAVSAAEPLRERLRAGSFGVRDALDDLDVAVLEPTEWRRVDPGGRFLVNVNDPDDLDHIAGIARS